MHLPIAFFLRHAYAILFGWVLMEQLGIPIPSIPLLLTAGTLSATHRMGAGWALASVLGACLVSDSMWFLLGRRYGGSVLNLLCRLSFESSTCVSKTRAYFGKRGAPTLLFAKFIPGLSTVAAPIAGQTGMSYPRFLLWDLTGSTIWALTFILAGRFFGDIAKRSDEFLALLGRVGAVLVVLMIVGFVAYRYIRQRRFLTGVRSMRVEPFELKAMMDDAEAGHSQAPFIVDLRHPLDYLPDPRVLPGAVRVGPTELEQRHQTIPRDRDIILYCTCPSEETSGRVALKLHKLGIDRVRPLRGGFDGWKTAGYPLLDYVETTSAIVDRIAPAPPVTQTQAAGS